MRKSDTTRQARQVQINLYQQMSPVEKLELVFDAYHTGQIISMAGISIQHPSANQTTLWHIWAKRHLGEDLYNKVYNKEK